MTFAQPIFLWSLTAISVPLAIHFLSRREGTVLKVGSLRHIGESNTSRFKSFRLNEVWLLLARCLMITWLALFLSGAQCTSPGSKALSKWLLIEQGMHNNKDLSGLIDSLQRDGFELRALSEGFPAYDESDSPTAPDYWGLAGDLRAKHGHEIVVLAYSYLRGFAQQRISQPSNIVWISVDPDPQEFTLHATRISDDSVAMRSAYSDARSTTYITSVKASHRSQDWIRPASALPNGKADSVPVVPVDTIRISISEDAAFRTDAKTLRSALNVIQREFFVHLSETDPGDAEWTFWLRDKRPETTMGKKLVRVAPQPSGELIRRTAVMEWTITRRLTPGEAIDSHFVTELAVLLLGKSESNVNDVRVMPDKMIWAGSGKLLNPLSDFSPTRDLSAILAVLLFLTWIAERVMALRKNL